MSPLDMAVMAFFGTCVLKLCICFYREFMGYDDEEYEEAVSAVQQNPVKKQACISQTCEQNRAA